MNNEFSIITKEDIEALNLSQSVQSVILEGVNIEKFTLFDLKRLVNNLVNLISKVMKSPSENKYNNVKYSYSYANMRKTTFRQIMLVGSLVVFRIRQFLLKESITFSLGATDAEGQLFERKISQDDLFQKIDGGKRLKLRSSLSSHAVVLSKTLEKFNEEDFRQVGQLNQWPKILELAFGGPALKDSGEVLKINDTYFYQKDNADNNVYVRYTEGKKALKQYYYDRNKLNFYNQGWLYEWYMEYLAQDPENEAKLELSLNRNSLEPIMGKMDAIPGYKGGDYIAENQQIQAKYHNQQIITFTSILNVLKEILFILNEWENHYNIELLSQNFVTLFTDDNTSIKRLNTTYNQIVEQQLLSLIKTS